MVKQFMACDLAPEAFTPNTIDMQINLKQSLAELLSDPVLRHRTTIASHRRAIFAEGQLAEERARNRALEAEVHLLREEISNVSKV